jgi:hypothetical protein
MGATADTGNIAGMARPYDGLSGILFSQYRIHWLNFDRLN